MRDFYKMFQKPLELINAALVAISILRASLLPMNDLTAKFYVCSIENKYFFKSFDSLA